MQNFISELPRYIFIASAVFTISLLIPAYRISRNSRALKQRLEKL
jgi:hypothetical protein